MIVFLLLKEKMMRTYRLYQVDAFTTERFTGNPAGVVPDATGLSDSEMQAIAREMNVSETAFIFPANGHDHDMTVRFFTPTTEVPICGHATIAAHWIRAYEGAPDGIVHEKTGAGILPVEIERKTGVTRIWMTQKHAAFETPFQGDVEEEMRKALGVPQLSAIAPVQIVTTGHSKVIVPVQSKAALHAMVPDLSALSRLSDRIGCNGFFAFTLADGDEDVVAHGRMFAPAIGIAEDPVTGNACGPLGAYLARHGLLAVASGDTVRFAVRQGEAMGRPGTVLVEVHHEGETFGVRVSGEAIIAFATSIEVGR